MPIRLFALTALALAASPAPAHSPASADPKLDDAVELVRYSCASNETMQVVFINTSAGNSFAVLLEQGEMIPMNLTPSASGAVYVPASKDDHYQLLTKGDTASLFTVDGGTDKPVKTDCKV